MKSKMCICPQARKVFNKFFIHFFPQESPTTKIRDQFTEEGKEHHTSSKHRACFSLISYKIHTHISIYTHQRKIKS